MHPVRPQKRSMLRPAVFAALAVLLLPGSLAAQYFGRNKVQYDRFDFRVMQTDHFAIHFYPEEAEASEDAARMAERWYQRLSDLFGHEFRLKRPIILYANHPDFQQTNVTGGAIGEGTGGFAEGLKDRVVLPFTGSYGTFHHVLGHEIVHAFQYDIAGQGASGMGAMGRLPGWAIEGMAEYLAGGRVDANTAMWLRDALRRDDIPTVRQLSDPRYFPYRFGQAFWAYVGGVYGDRTVGRIYKSALERGFAQSLTEALGLSEAELSEQWHQAIREHYEPTLEGRVAPTEVGRLVLSEETGSGAVNVGPGLSPDGRYVAVITEKDLFTFDLWLADAETGRLVRRLASSETDAHIDALSFLESGGAWSRDGRQLAYVVFSRGDHQLAILDVESGATRVIGLEGIPAMRDLAWSPDGRHIVISGIVGGLSDLYLVDIQDGGVRQLTSDRHAALQPSFSPDGRTIAFTSDRGLDTDFDHLLFGEMQISLLDLETGEVNTLDIFDGAKHINPVFSPDGRDLFFVSDRDGFSDVYRLDLVNGTVHQLTRISTGVTGFTALAPALAVAAEHGRMMFSVFEGEGRFAIMALEPGELLGTPVEDVGPIPAPGGVLPPFDAAGAGVVAGYLDDPITGLSDEHWPVTPYDPGLTLDYVGTPGVGIGTDQFGNTGVGGAVAGFFSDILGNRQAAVAVQASGTVRDIGAQGIYLNTRGRWNFGAGAAHIPLLSARTSVRSGVPTDQGILPGRTIQQLIQRVYVDQVMGMAQYPISSTHRFDFQGGVTRYGYTWEVREVGQLATGPVVFDRTTRVDPDTVPGLATFPTSFNLAQASAAFVGDFSFFAFTSPVRGGRYRFEAEGTVGDLNYGTLLGDYRRYLFYNPVTLAFRGLHFGRYGGDAENRALQPLYLGYPTLVRGYAFETFEAGECTSSGEGETSCREFDQLIGSRIAVGNIELRLPLFGVQRFGLFEFGFLPTELTAFFDAGHAWGRDDGNDTDGGGFAEIRSFDRDWVFSLGTSARMNLFGYLVLELYYAYPFQRPQKGGHFGLNIAPGW